MILPSFIDILEPCSVTYTHDNENALLSRNRKWSMCGFVLSPLGVSISNQDVISNARLSVVLAPSRGSLFLIEYDDDPQNNPFSFSSPLGVLYF